MGGEGMGGEEKEGGGAGEGKGRQGREGGQGAEARERNDEWCQRRGEGEDSERRTGNRGQGTEGGQGTEDREPREDREPADAAERTPRGNDVAKRM